MLWVRKHKRENTGIELKVQLVWVELSRDSRIGGWTESGLWGFRFSPGLEVRVLDPARCDYIFLGVGGVPAPTV